MNWTCPIKHDAREATIPPNIQCEYWALGSPEEYAWAVQTGRTDASRFHGVEINPTTYAHNVSQCPETNWHLGDLYAVMEQHYDRGDFDPSFVNVDLFQSVETAANYVAHIMQLVTDFEATVLANFVLKHRGCNDTPGMLLPRLAREPLFRAAYRNGWTWSDRYYQYTRKNTTMCSLTFFSPKIDNPNLCAILE